MEELIEKKGCLNAIGLVFVERRITAMALHAYFLWRSEQIGIGSGSRAKETRQLQSTVNSVFQMNITSVDDGGEDCDMFDDAEDDPFHSIPQENPVWKCPISLPKECSTSPRISPELQCSSFMQIDTKRIDNVSQQVSPPTESVKKIERSCKSSPYHRVG